MNEKIKELAEQSGWLHACKHGGVHSSLDEDWIKFAELIVQECASLCYNSNLKDADIHAMNILNHFNIDGARHWK